MKKNAWIVTGLAAFALVLAALPSRSAIGQETSTRKVKIAPGHRLQDVQDVTVRLGDEGPSWLGVEAREVTPGNVKELKLPAERGVVVGRIAPDSPAAKAGLKENDVITEVDGQRVEGSAQFRRMIHEIPGGRTLQLTVWRDARSQTLSATLGLAEETHHAWMNTEPGAFVFQMPEVEIPEMPEVAEIPDMPSMEFGDGMVMLPGGHPRLGIDAEEVSGQLGAYFGAPDGEGVLVRNVNAGSPAEKAGVKAGDVITAFNGERIRSLGDLREKLAAKNDDKPAKLAVWRNKSTVTLSVELPAPKTKTLHKLAHSTNI